MFENDGIKLQRWREGQANVPSLMGDSGVQSTPYAKVLYIQPQDGGGTGDSMFKGSDQAIGTNIIAGSRLLGSTFCAIEMWINRVGNPPGTFIFTIRKGADDSIFFQRGPFPCSAVSAGTGNYDRYVFEFPPYVTATNDKFLVEYTDATTSDGSNLMKVKATNAGTNSGARHVRRTNSGTYVNDSTAETHGVMYGF